MTIKFMVGMESEQDDAGDEHGPVEPSPWLDELARAHERLAEGEQVGEAAEVRAAGWLLSGAERNEDEVVVAIWAW
jgi:hypothetical protein